MDKTLQKSPSQPAKSPVESKKPPLVEIEHTLMSDVSADEYVLFANSITPGESEISSETLCKDSINDGIKHTQFFADKACMYAHKQNTLFIGALTNADNKGKKLIVLESDSESFQAKNINRIFYLQFKRKPDIAALWLFGTIAVIKFVPQEVSVVLLEESRSFRLPINPKISDKNQECFVQRSDEKIVVLMKCNQLIEKWTIKYSSKKIDRTFLSEQLESQTTTEEREELYEPCTDKLLEELCLPVGLHNRFDDKSLANLKNRLKQSSSPEDVSSFQHAYLLGILNERCHSAELITTEQKLVYNLHNPYLHVLPHLIALEPALRNYTFEKNEASNQPSGNQPSTSLLTDLLWWLQKNKLADADRFQKLYTMYDANPYKNVLIHFRNYINSCYTISVINDELELIFLTICPTIANMIPLFASTLKKGELVSSLLQIPSADRAHLSLFKDLLYVKAICTLLSIPIYFEQIALQLIHFHINPRNPLYNPQKSLKILLDIAFFLKDYDSACLVISFINSRYIENLSADTKMQLVKETLLPLSAVKFSECLKRFAASAVNSDFEFLCAVLLYKIAYMSDDNWKKEGPALSVIMVSILSKVLKSQPYRFEGIRGKTLKRYLNHPKFERIECILLF